MTFKIAVQQFYSLRVYKANLHNLARLYEEIIAVIREPANWLKSLELTVLEAMGGPRLFFCT